MSFQDKYREYKERQEAKNYFRSNNDQFLDTSEWIKVIAGGLLASVACGIILGIVIYVLHITSSLFYIICGFAVAKAVTTLANVHSKQIAAVSVVLTFVCFVVGEMTWSFLPLYEIGISLQTILSIDWIVATVQSLFMGDLFTTILVVLGLFVAYQQSE